jgi:choline-sulfatase
MCSILRFRALFVILAAMCAACSRGPSRNAAQPSNMARNVLLITIDSLRADHVGAYGDADARTPTLDALAAGGVRFDRAYASAPLTLPSHASLLTGRHPPHHGARSDGARIEAAAPTIADAFHRRGFATAAFVSASALDGRSGLDRGFDTYEAAAPNQVEARAKAWLEAHREPRVFVWVHLVAPHAPYGNPADPARAARPAVDRYDDEVTDADAQAGRLIAALGPRRTGTLVVVTSDHGEAFGEHGEITHGLFVYDTTLRVPLILNGPAISRGRVVADPVSLVDVAPTVAALAGVGPFGGDGDVILPAEVLPPKGGSYISTGGRYLYSETYAPLTDFGWSPLRTIRRGDWKYIAAPQPELYDVKTDPGETRNLVDDQPARAAELARDIEAISPSEAVGGAARVDPKDRRTIAARIAEVASGELQGPLLERALREIIRDDPGNGVGNLRLGELLAGSHRCKEALKRFTLASAAHAPGADTSPSRARCQ